MSEYVFNHKSACLSEVWIASGKIGAIYEDKRGEPVFVPCRDEYSAEMIRVVVEAMKYRRIDLEYGS